MDATTARTAGRMTGAALLLACSSAVAFHAWLGWGDVPRHHPDPLTGSTGGASSGWQLAGYVGTLAVLCIATAWRLSPWLPTVVLPPAVLVTATLSMRGEDPFWTIAVAFLTTYVGLGTAGLAALTAVVHHVWRGRRADRAPADRRPDAIR